jgi:hypothetical protein
MTSKEARALINDELDGYFESPHDDPPTWAVMLTLYLDETLSKEESLWVVAGYLGKKSNWRKYVPAWADALSPKNSIHLADLRLGSRNAKRRHGDMLERLGLVPKQCGLLPFAGSVIVRDYNLDVKDTSLAGC